MKNLKNLLKIIDDIESINIENGSPTITSFKEFKFLNKIGITIRIPKEKFIKEIIKKLHELDLDVHAIETKPERFGYIATLILGEEK